MEDGLRVSIVALLVLTCAACHRSAEKRIAVIPKATSSVFWQSVQAGALAAGQKDHVAVMWTGPPEVHGDAIAIAASDRDALSNALDRAAKENIPVTIFDSGVNSKNYMTFLATDNLGAGKMAARKLGELLQGKGTVAEIQHAPGSQSTGERERGFESVMASDFPKIQIVARQYSMSDRAKGMTVTENILTANPHLDGLFASSEPSSVGAAQALKARGLNGKIRFVAFDASQGLVDSLEDGTIDALVAQDPFRIGLEAVGTLADKLNGKQPAKLIELPATVITKADLQKPEIHALLFPDLKKYLP
jgi:ribose transport system substrate-binding protein